MSAPTPPFSLRIFVANGDPDGLRLVERSNWVGKAVIFPRAIYPDVRSRSEFDQPGIYILLGPGEFADRDKIYVGEGDPVRPRLESHYSKKDFWTKAVFFVAGIGQLNKAHVQYLEARLVELAKEANRMELENANSPGKPSLSEADRADMDVFLQNILGMLPVLGIYAFEKAQSVVSIGSAAVLTCQGRGVTATGKDASEGFVVLSGSSAATVETESLAEWFPGASALRKDLLKSGILAANGPALQFTQDYVFSSPSYASSVILGRTSNGRTDWKDATGRTLKELQESKTEVSGDIHASVGGTVVTSELD